MVDEIGGIDDAIAYAAHKGNLEEGNYEIRILPQPKSLGDILTGNGADAAMSFRPKIQVNDPLLQGLAPIFAKGLGRQLQMLQLLQDRPVVLVAPFEVTIK